ncbi:hypothetical protein Pint_18483 [Pistacia integerrima]|uniref:Uncharacterized protein n=1 Tax=Pistacia integerrima TaxID=434235 RepID=A0ACC0YZP3_9ROSI|nr:hypothetical protein Pint_18483 [Pistacia integerrima]
MDSTATATTTVVNDKESMVDPFLVEALQNPRHRLTRFCEIGGSFSIGLD